MKLIAAIALIFLGAALVVFGAGHELQAGIAADRDQTAGVLNPVMIVAIAAGVVGVLSGLFLLYKNYESWRNSRDA
ncbi:hypothetical protein [Rathayibacter iranicus]|uniref:DUF3185 domain-containing protein n=2 Tax=Rathayibacter iranicus TaxID=59737 RepID=A0AAD1EM27_9MICO|nr:hypothetical protein [Rathayibacter iranicus]AZZ55124.1 hypothetical protein C7V51_03905 [Rathayibacter iranicus]MWV32355.1 hypothetical protein [Rathayibacter iranicus NCPPB 2253 = VKM Ac-1602]PPI49439.1 hypothetical protein C5E09_02980 [Rathayibacter iranicus]PPI61803.1 hypothetical protein C5E08_03890 [Rathayibacter iranicus]PPI73378.1 hypothetical protein C5E01_02960 [Rathayibacter iranicus]